MKSRINRINYVPVSFVEQVSESRLSDLKTETTQLEEELEQTRYNKDSSLKHFPACWITTYYQVAGRILRFGTPRYTM